MVSPYLCIPEMKSMDEAGRSVNGSGRFFSTTNIVCLLALLLNVGLFCMVNTMPIRWHQGEIAYNYLYWSRVWSDRDDNYELRSGLHATDFLKLVNTEQFGYEFRPRHFTYLLELLTFKLKQYVDPVNFRNHTVIVLHLLNVGLIFYVMRRLTGHFHAALVTALLVLNSGVGLSTLLFPFLCAKPLLVLLFLSAWGVMAAGRKHILEAPGKRLAAFCVLFFLALFTDELVFVLFPVLFFDMGLTEKMTAQRLRRLLTYAGVTVVLFFVVAGIFYGIDAGLGSGVHFTLLRTHVGKLLAVYPAMDVVRDTGKALGAYFLRRNFGYWDSTFRGVAAGLSFFGLILMIVVRKPGKTAWRRAGVLFLMIAIKAVWVPHSWGYHSTIMPEGTVFPSLLFFNYYYTYSDMILFALALGFLLQAALVSDRRLVVAAAIFVSLIGLSNAVHRREGIADTINFHGPHQVNLEVIPPIIKIREIVRKAKGDPVYLAYPSGSQSTATIKLAGDETVPKSDPDVYRLKLLPSFYNYNSILPVRYLRDLEQGRLIISLNNARRPRPVPPGHELTAARYYYDVPTEQFLDLKAIIGRYGPEALLPAVVSDGIPMERKIQLSPDMAGQRFIVFVKGPADLTLNVDGKPLHVWQSYGHSYQMLAFPLTGNVKNFTQPLTLTVAAKDKDFAVTLVGPFLLDSRIGRFQDMSLAGVR